MAAWRHLGARLGFEVVFFRWEQDGYSLEGHATGVEEGEAWGIRYLLTLDASWVTRSAHILGRSARGAHEIRIEGDGRGSWRIDGASEPLVTGCLDVDLEASACTNAVPVNRLRLGVGQRAEVPAVYVRAPDLRVERLEQSYHRVPDDGEHSRYEYLSPAFDFEAVLVYDAHGLVVDYPGIAVRVM